MDTSALHVTEHPATPVLARGATKTSVLLRVETVAQAPAADALLGLDVVVVLDHSESMEDVLERDVDHTVNGGSRIALAHRVVRALCELLRPGDRLGIVLFGKSARVYCPLADVVDVRAFDRKLAALPFEWLETATNIGAGLIAGFNMLRHSPPVLQNERVVILLTDGMTNTGIVDPVALLAHTVEAAPDDVSVNTLGIGDDHDAVLLSVLANGLHGQYAFIDTNTSMVRAFANIVGARRTIAVRDVRVALRAADWLIDDVNTAYPLLCLAERREYTVRIPYLSAGERRDILIDLVAPDIRPSHQTPPPRTAATNLFSYCVCVAADVKLVTCSLLNVDADGGGGGDSNLLVNSEVAKHRERVRMVRELQDVLHWATAEDRAASLARIKEHTSDPTLRNAVQEALASGSLNSVHALLDDMSQQRDRAAGGTLYQGQCFDELSVHVDALEAREEEPPAKRQRTDAADEFPMTQPWSVDD